MFDELLSFRNTFNVLKKRRKIAKKPITLPKPYNPYENEMAAVILAAVGAYLKINPAEQGRIIAVSNETYSANDDEIAAVISAAIGIYLKTKQLTTI